MKCRPLLRSSFVKLWSAMAATVALAALTLSATDQPVDFSRQILPILSDNCFACHGPDEQQRKAKLRLDVEADAHRANGDGDAALVPGDPGKSLLIQRIITEDEIDLMPPAKTGKKLSPAQIELLTRWVQQGAKYEKHWAFVPPQRPPAPEVRDRRWAQNDIDGFVLARLERENLKPSPEADKETLVRRVSLDMTGLPPTPQEVDAFLADKSPAAYEKVVDRLLASPRYGENMARYWMDAARYADSHGYHIDAERHLWKWRDWVIEAFNRNLPYDRFTTEQLAGDLLPNATTEQKVASGFLRNNMSTGEGGAIEEEYLAKYTFDRAETTSTLWLGLTMSCARCHTHKYDPITQREYYGLYSFFHNLDEPVMDGNRPNPDPFLKLPTKEQGERLEWLEQEIAVQEQKLEAADPVLDVRQEAWMQQWRERLGAHSTSLKPTAARSVGGATLQVREDGSVLASGANPDTDTHELSFRVPATTIAGLRLEALPDPSLPQAASGRGDDGSFRLSEIELEWSPPVKEGEAPNFEKLGFARAFASSWEGEHEPGRAIDKKGETGWSLEAALRGQTQAGVLLLPDPVDLPEGAQVRVRLRQDAPQEHLTLGAYRVALLAGGDLLATLFPPRPAPWKLLGPLKSPDPATGLATVYEPETELDFEKAYPGVREEVRWHDRGDLEDGKNHLLVNELHGVHGVYYLHRVLTLPRARKVELALRADDVFKLWVNGRLVATRTDKEKPGEGPLRVMADLPAGESRLLLKIVNLQGACHFSFRPDASGPDAVPPDVAAWLLSAPRLASGPAGAVRRYFRRASSPEWKELADQVALWKEEKTAIDRAVVTTLVAKERSSPRETRMLMRGEYDKPGEAVTAGVPAILPPLPAGAPTNRLGLARWLLDPSHPLTARVTVNRFWQQYFGIGLVKTAEDFGVQGEQPSHPGLLDWLATEFVSSGWDVKRLQRLIVTSATYRQASRWRDGLGNQDPENRLLARGPRFRADAEVVRDQALAVSGLLVEVAGGPSAKPYEPPGLWEAVSYNNAQKYVQDRGDGNYRRSLYTHWKRQSPPPNMLLFDAPSREFCVVRRPRTNTPLQALDLLNDPQYVEASRAFAQRILLEGGRSIESRIAYGFRLATARLPNRDEVKLLRQTLDRQWEEYRGDPAAAEQLLGVGAFPPTPGLDKAELAAWTTIATLLLNLDETVTKS